MTDTTKLREEAAAGAARQAGQRGIDADANQSDGIGAYARARGVPYDVLEAHIVGVARQRGIDPGQALGIARMWHVEEFDRWLASQGVPPEHQVGGMRVRPPGLGDSAPSQNEQAAPMPNQNHLIARGLVAHDPDKARMIDAIISSQSR